jgi:RHS repeat-associated protein
MGYAGDGVRQQFTGKERDAETALDYFSARYCSSTQGRFPSVDPENAGAEPNNPQSWNAYAYTYNNPVNYQDPDGMEVKICGTDGGCTDKDTHLSDEEFQQTFPRQQEHQTKGWEDL